MFCEQRIDEELGRPVWILQRGVAAVDGQGALDATVMRFLGRRQILRSGDIIEQTQPRIEISLVSINAVKPEEHDCQLRVPRQAQMVGKELPVFANLRD